MKTTTTVFIEKISYLVKKSLLHIEFIFIDGQKTITKDNTTQQQYNTTTKKSWGYVHQQTEVLVKTHLN